MLCQSFALFSVLIILGDALSVQDGPVKLNGASPMAMWRLQKVLMDGTAEKRDAAKLFLVGSDSAMDEMTLRGVMPIMSAEKRAPPAGFWGTRGKRNVPDFYDYDF